MVRTPLVTVDSVNLDNAINMKVAILDRMGPVDGLLGLDFLNHFDIDIDRVAGEIVLRQRYLGFPTALGYEATSAVAVDGW